MKKIKNEEIRLAKIKYDEVVDKYYSKKYKYDQLFYEAECYDCDFWERGKEQHVNCKNTAKCLAVVKMYKDAEKAFMLIKEAKKKYAKVIFDVLSELKPKLKERVSKKIIEWDKAFPSKFEEITEELQDALIELIDSDGTIYQFKDIKIVT